MMERGIRRLEIFQDEFDYQVFLEILKKESEQKRCSIHAYCLITNHFHLLAETQNVEIGKFMKSLAGKYAMYYNHRHSYKGHVFEDRYKSCLVETDEYFLQTSRYIHLNPVKAKMTEHPEDYKCHGILPMIIAAQRNGIKKVIIPVENLKEAKLVQGVTIIGLQNLSEVVRFLEGKNVDVNRMSDKMEQEDCEKVVDFADVKGQKELIDAVILAAVGGHNMLMIGEPGCGKTMIAQRIPTILPEMTEAECLEVTKIYSISGILPNGHGLIRHRPFRAPHHNASLNALIGGGANALPGEVSLAHNGVLFLDELAEFPRRTLDALRQPIEDKQVCISRVNGTHTFPSNFMFITAMNPCPCGYFPGSKCRCTDYEIIKYRGKISGPIMDRIDIQKEVKPVNYFELEQESYMMTSREIREKVKKARKIQQIRYQNEPGINCNAQMSTALLQKYCVLDEKSRQLLKETSEKYGYSARVIHKLLRMARTSADLAEVENIRMEDVKRILNYRDLDRNNSKMLVVN